MSVEQNKDPLNTDTSNNQDNNEQNNNNNNEQNKDSGSDTNSEDLIDKKVNEQLAKIKENLDKAYKERDRAMEEAKSLAKAEKEMRLKMLEQDGKHDEANKLRIADLEAQNAALLESNTRLSRDSEVRDSLRGLEFKNDRSADLAFKEIIGNLVRDKDGTWAAKDGSSLREYVTNFAKDEENSFLFKAKQSSGSGGAPLKGGTPPTDAPKSLFDLTQDEVVKLAAAGKLTQGKQFGY